jgi:NAD(P)-dependent dehydrogenase (short-subunit alcohol dehydrogenase family)
MVKQIEKIALVTGGSRGIGRSTVLSLAKKGVNSIFTYNTNLGEAEKVAELVQELGCKAVFLQLDTGVIGSFDTFVQSVTNALVEFGTEHFDYLVNNAGISHHKDFDKITEQELDDVYNVHFKGVLFLTQKLLPLINDGGRIVNISTCVTRAPSPDSCVYASMKGAVEVMSRCLAKVLAPRRITVNVVAPSATATDFSGGIVRDNPEMNKRIAAGTLLGRVGLPDDIGAMISSLLSEDNHWVNGQRIEVSGGTIM